MLETQIIILSLNVNGSQHYLNKQFDIWLNFELLIKEIATKHRGLGPTNKNTLKNSLNSCQTFIAKIDNQCFRFCSNETVLRNISRLIISWPS